MVARELSHAELLRRLKYEPDTGVLSWLVRPCQRIKAGERAGFTHHRGYRGVTIAGRRYAEHRVAWFYVHGSWPARELDHINGVRSDNRIANLRPASRQENMRNKRRYKNNTTGFKGVTWSKRHSRFLVRIQTGAGEKYLGMFADGNEAHRAYAAAARQIFGDFARDA